MDRAEILAASAAALAQSPAWIATGGPQGRIDAVQSTFLAPVVRGAAWLHERDGTIRLIAMDPHDVVVQVQRAANAALRARGERPIREDAIWGPETRRGMIALARWRGTAVSDAIINVALLELALAGTFHAPGGVVVIPRSAEAPSLDRAQRVASTPSGHSDARVVAPAASAPRAPVCEPRLVLASLPPGADAARWAQMDDAARLAAWRAWSDAHPDASVPGCPPGASVASIVVADVPPTAGTMGLTSGRVAALAVGIAGLAFVAHVAARELRRPTPPPTRRFGRAGRLVPRRAK